MTLFLGFIDGNHEDFGELKKLPNNSEGLGQVSDNVFYIPRGTVWQWRGTRFAGLGGAVSIDRQTRTPGRSWFPEEAITASDVANAKQAGTVDVLFTHDAPLPPVPKRSFGPTIDADCDQSIAYVAEVVSALRPNLVIHGHYHLAYVNGDEVPGTLIVGLDCDMGLARDNYVDLIPGRPDPLVGRGDAIASGEPINPGLRDLLEEYEG
ncbi:MAG: metallophosphoesterase family protein [Scrofimicrobium sp.]